MNQHIPVLIDQVITVLNPQVGETFLDTTAGYGGHSEKILTLLGASGKAILCDQDNQAIEVLERQFAGDQRVTIKKINFRNITEGEIPKVDLILMDLGVSSPQLDRPERGFSFRSDAPLDMRMDQSTLHTARELLATVTEAELARILWEYGQESQSRQIAHAVVRARQRETIYSTVQLARIVESVKPRRGKIHPATKTFQALRIAVNDELGALEQALGHMTDQLKVGGRWAVISFHSLEDRLVKAHFNRLTTSERDWRGQVVLEAKFKKVTKKAIKGDRDDNNPRARSARLRAVVKIK